MDGDKDVNTLEYPGERRASERQVNDVMTFTDLVTYFRVRFGANEEGQTMAEYGVVLAVIAAIVVAALVALQGGITGAIDRVTSFL